MRKMHLAWVIAAAMAPVSAWAAPFVQNFSFGTPAEQAAWTVTTNNDANGPGVPQYGVPDAGSVRIQPIDASTKNTGDIRLYRTITAPAGTTFSNIVFSGIGQGYGSHVTWADLLISHDANWGTSNSDSDVVFDRANSGYDEENIVANATGNPLYTGVTTVYLQVRIVDALAIGGPATNSPYARALQFTAETTPVPEPAAAGLVALVSGVLLGRLRK